MPRKIVKVKLDTHQLNEVAVPFGVDPPQILSATVRYDEPGVDLFIEIDPDEERERILRFEVFEIGEEMRTDMGISREFVASAFMTDASRQSFHIYQRTN